MQKTFRRYLLLFLVLVLAPGALIIAQSRDHLTEKEIELVRDTQLLDKRIEVFIRAVERRLLVMNSTASSNSKQLQKEAELWGELPKGNRSELIGDIAKILDEAITNIDDVSMHDDKNPLLAKALRRLATEATQLKSQLLPLREQAKSEEELGNLEQLLANAQSIIDAAVKLPPPTETKGKKKSDKAKEKN